jgi:hypothetical protein
MIKYPVTCPLNLGSLASDGKSVGISPPEQVERGEVGDSATSSAQVQSQTPKRRGRPPKSSNKLGNVKTQPLTLNPATDGTISSPYPGSHDRAVLPRELTAPRSSGSKKSGGGLKGRNASLLTFSKKKGTLETIRGRTVKDDEAQQDTDEVLELLESNSARLDSVAHGSGSEIPLRDKDSTATTSEKEKLANNGDTEDHSLPDYEEQPLPISPSNLPFESGISHYICAPTLNEANF